MNWIDEYIHQIVYGPLPTIDVDTGDTIMQVKINGVWQNIESEDKNEKNSNNRKSS